MCDSVMMHREIHNLHSEDIKHLSLLTEVVIS